MGVTRDRVVRYLFKLLLCLQTGAVPGSSGCYSCHGAG